MKRILITGASGFIGSHIAEYFQDKGEDIVCLTRQQKTPEIFKELELKSVYGDVRDFDSLKQIFKGFDLIIHNAAMAKDWGSYQDFYDINVKGTENVINAAIQNGISNLIITGSISSYGEENNLNIKDENSPFNPTYPYLFYNIFPSGMNFYRETKALLTQKAIELAEKHNLGDSIVFTGKLTQKEWHELSEDYDIFINTTNVDNTPVSVIEAMALGLPVVSTNVGGLPYLLDDGKDAILVNKGDVKGMINAVMLLLDDKKMEKKLSVNGRKKAESFDWHNVKKQWKQLLN